MEFKLERCDVCLSKKLSGVCLKCAVDNMQIARIQGRKFLRRVANQFGIVARSISSNLSDLKSKRERHSDAE